jgi:predicted metalloendopeptidase
MILKHKTSTYKQNNVWKERNATSLETFREHRRWCTCEVVGQMYVEKYFPAAAKERMVTLVKNLQTS